MTRFIPIVAIASTLALVAFGCDVASAARVGGNAGPSGPGPGPSSSNAGKSGGDLQLQHSCSTLATHNGLVGPAWSAFVARCAQGGV